MVWFTFKPRDYIMRLHGTAVSSLCIYNCYCIIIYVYSCIVLYWIVALYSCIVLYTAVLLRCYAVLYLRMQLYCIVFLYTAVLRISGALEQSTEVMASMQQLLKVEDISATMRELSQEMMKVCTSKTCLVIKFKRARLKKRTIQWVVKSESHSQNLWPEHIVVSITWWAF